MGGINEESNSENLLCGNKGKANKNIFSVPGLLDLKAPFPDKYLPTNKDEFSVEKTGYKKIKVISRTPSLTDIAIMKKGDPTRTVKIVPLHGRKKRVKRILKVVSVKPQVEDSKRSIKDIATLARAEFAFNYAEGLRYLDRGDYHLSVKAFESALRHNPNHKEAQRFLVLAITKRMQARRKSKDIYSRIENISDSLNTMDTSFNVRTGKNNQFKRLT
ncbi:MAG: tetratricopeptide repeat protein [Thermoplasmata archaeon]|nr:MAG: tetratricopeptide repeat protein [Thermoplasmata archaeon]